MPWIQNVGRGEIIRGWHYDAGPNSLLIQITDPDEEHPTPLYPFLKTMQFKFLDIEEEHEHAPKPHHAKAIFHALQEALENRRNVIVHCHAGICRSGAVAEIGVVMGFDDTEAYRQPNILLKKYLFDEYTTYLDIG